MLAIFRVNEFASIPVLSNVYQFGKYKRVQKDFLRGKHLSPPKNLYQSYRQLIVDLVFNQQLQFGSESYDETKTKIQKLNILIAEIFFSNIYN